jgi:MoxR-like ATPase
MSESVKEYASTVVQAVKQEMYGVDEVVRLALVALYTEGHVLLEGNPGLGKTELVKTLSKTLQFSAGRIQFTPDLMPADITGTLMPHPDNPNQLRFQKGPIFTELLLADEINRATPKTQSAMLEAMAERQVTVLGETHALPTPFMVLATQNPIDHEGTYDLPAAQADRFMFKVLMPHPGTETLRRIMHKTAGAVAGDLPQEEQGRTRRLPTYREDALHIHAEIKMFITNTLPLPSVEAHILNIVLASNQQFEQLEGLDRVQSERVRWLVGDCMTYGLGPRTSIALMRGAKAWSLLFIPEATHAVGAALAQTAIPVLRHRVKLDLDWEHRYTQFAKLDGEKQRDLLGYFLADFIAATAPTLRGVPGYRDAVRHEFANQSIQLRR